MSLESYLQELEKQRKFEGEYNSDEKEKSRVKNKKKEEVKHLTETSIKPKGRSRRFVLTPLVLTICFLCGMALIKNPSQLESKEIIKMTAVQHINNYFEKQSEETDNGWEKFGYGIAKLLTPTAYDAMVQTEIDDYVLFTKFSASFNLGEEKKYVKGIILFGKVIPLDTNIQEFIPVKKEQE